MEIIKVACDQVIAKKNDIVKYWYLVQEGTVIQKIGFLEVKLEKNAIIGFLERDMYLFDYVAGEDTVLAAFTCNNSEDLLKALTGQERVRSVFLKAAIEQRHQLLSLYSDLSNKSRRFHMIVQIAYNDYKGLCSKYKIEQIPFTRIEHLKPLMMQHKAESWEMNNSVSLINTYKQEYLQLMEKDDSLTVGVIMEAAAQMRRFSLGICEMEAYLQYNRDILLGDNYNTLFDLYFDLAVKMSQKRYDIKVVTENVQLIVKFAEKLGIFNQRMVQRRLNEFIEYDFSLNRMKDNTANTKNIRKEIDITTIDCLEQILEYAGYSDDEFEQIQKQIISYRELPDMMSMDNEVYSLRKRVTADFYDIYYRVFIHAVEDESTMTPIIEMFLNFGFMDVGYIGEERSRDLYELCAHLDICRSHNVYTIFEWLKCIYSGEKEPSKNEFDLSYSAYLTEQCKAGKMTLEQQKEAYHNPKMRVEFEIKNMFASVNKATYGKPTTFCPILNKNDLFASVEKMLVTAEKLEKTMNEVRKIDYSVFYREVPFSDPKKGINNEWLMKEIVPDIILMPNAGTHVMMWQEITGVRSNTEGRFMFPIFTAVELEDMMLEVIGRFRWEMCRRIQGVRWNDVREKSLTAEYCNYIQFYRMNHELSPESKEKIKGALVRARNNYREVFVRDYINWIKYESKGSFRLNKIARDIMVQFCPFTKSVRDELKTNPLYQASITRFEVENAKKLQRYQAVYLKYEKAGGEINADLKENLTFYEM